MGGKELLIFAGFLLVWFALNRFILPWLGIPTCMSGQCGWDRRPALSNTAADEDKIPQAPRDGLPASQREPPPDSRATGG